MKISSTFLTRAEWWFLPFSESTTGEVDNLEDIFWKHTGRLDTMCIDAGFPINVNPQNKLNWIEIKEVHMWMDLFMWRITQ